MNSQLLIRQLQRYRNRQVLVDANLLLLYFVGALRPDFIASFNRTSAYCVEDFLLLEALFAYFKKFATTPHVLTEVSNLMGQCHEPLCSELRGYLARAIQPWKECLNPARKLTQALHFPRFGLTDTAIIEVKPGAYLILTDDHSLAGLLQKRGTDAIRFSDLQQTCL